MVERSGTGWHTPTAIPDGNTAALDAEMDRQDAADERHAELLARYPLADFEDEAWLHFYDPAYGALADLAEVYPDAAALALCKFAGLNHGCYTTSEAQVSGDITDIKNWITLWIEDEMERLQAEKIENEI